VARLDVLFINDEWVEKVNNKQERGAYRPTKEEWRKYDNSMPNSRVGMLFDFSVFMKKNPKENERFKFRHFVY
jgi:hypothetical protein